MRSAIVPAAMIPAFLWIITVLYLSIWRRSAAPAPLDQLRSYAIPASFAKRGNAAGEQT
jgi:hypothetical protein